MRYMLMRVADTQTEQGALPSEQLLKAMAQYNESMLNAGVLLSGDGLRPSNEGCRIEFTDGQPVVTNGPFHTSRDLVAGYYILDVDSQEEAIMWASQWPRLDNDGNVSLALRRYYEIADFAPGEAIEQHQNLGERRARLPAGVSMHLVFPGNCREAMTFYADVLGGRVGMMLTYGETPAAQQVPEELHNQIIHAEVNVGRFTLMGADMAPTCYQPPHGLSVQLHFDDSQQGRKAFDKLAEGGSIQMPFERTFWAEGFGMLTDRFGIAWMINCAMIQH